MALDSGVGPYSEPRRNHLDQREVLAECAGLRELLLVDTAVLLPLGTQDSSFVVLAANKGFVLAMSARSVAGALIGGLVLGVVPSAVLIPLLVDCCWRHR